MKILLIDDDIRSVDIRKTLLEIGGHDIEVAHTGYEGVQMFKDVRPDCTVLDLMLPDVDGALVFEYLRLLDPNCRVVVLTGRMMVPVELQAQANAIVIKGSGVERLLAALEG